MSAIAVRQPPPLLQKILDSRPSLLYAVDEHHFNQRNANINKDRSIETIMLEVSTSDKGKTICVRHRYAEPTSKEIFNSPRIAEVRHQSANRHATYALAPCDDEALTEVLKDLERLLDRNIVMRRAVTDGITPWFGYIVHPVLLLFPSWKDNLFAHIDISNGPHLTTSYVHEGHVITGNQQLHDHKITISSKSRQMNIAMALPDTVISSLEKRRLSELIDHPIAELIRIKSAKKAQYFSKNGKHQPSIGLTFEPSWVRLQRIPEAYKGSWAEITKTIDDRLEEIAAKKKKKSSL